MLFGDIGTVFLICFCYFFGTFICGYAPSLLRVSPKIMELFTIYASGTIIGAVLGIVLPQSALLMIKAESEIA